MAGLLLGYWALMTLVPVPGFGAGLLDSKEGNLAAYVDRAIFGRHIWSQGKVYDPEGLLSTLPAIATTLAGVLTASIFLSNISDRRIWVLLALGPLLASIAARQRRAAVAVETLEE